MPWLSLEFDARKIKVCSKHFSILSLFYSTASFFLNEEEMVENGLKIKFFYFKNEIASKFCIRGIPALIILDGDTGLVHTRNGDYFFLNLEELG
jgi:hypothetical protein